MATRVEEPTRFGSAPCEPLVHWQQFTNAYECRVLLCPEDEGGYSAHALRLPGVVSEGETVDEALEAVSEAFSATIEVYKEQHRQIPWQDVDIERTKGTIERWLLVNV